MTVVDVHSIFIHFKQSYTRDLDGLDTKSLKVAALVITDTLTYVHNVHNLRIFNKTIHDALKRAKIFTIFQVWRLQTTDQF